MLYERKIFKALLCFAWGFLGRGGAGKGVVIHIYTYQT